MTVADILAIPSLHSWFNAAPALFNSGTGVYADKGPRGNNWKNATVGQQPTPVANWHSTGLPALSFDGVDDRIPADHVTIVGPMTIVVVADMNNAGAVTCLVGQNSGSTSRQGLNFGFFSQRLRLFSRNGGTSGGTVLTNGTPHIFVGNIDPLGNTLDVSFDGGSWLTAGVTFTSVNTDSSLQIGAYQTATGNIVTTSIADVLTFTDALKGTADLATVIATMKTLYGIP